MGDSEGGTQGRSEGFLWLLGRHFENSCRGQLGNELVQFMALKEMGKSCAEPLDRDETEISKVFKAPVMVWVRG